MMSGGVSNDWTHNENVGPKNTNIDKRGVPRFLCPLKLCVLSFL